VGVAQGEARRGPASDEACGPPSEHPRTGSEKPLAGTGGLLGAALTRQNLHAAWKRVKANKGAAGMDGLDILDRVNHDILIDRLKRRIDDAGVIRLIRVYLNAGIMDGGVVVDRNLGTPQGRPLSPLLANGLLDAVDKALEARGHSFARYADDCLRLRGQHQGRRAGDSGLTCWAGRRTSGWRKRQVSGEGGTNGCATDCGRFSSGSGSGPARSTASSRRWGPRKMSPDRWRATATGGGATATEPSSEC
jgi:hypothetical protein